MKREDVYKLIDGEREYQNTRWEEGRPMIDAETPVAAWILYMETHLNLAKKEIYFLKKDVALEQIRKVTALGVACMENNDTKARKE